MELVCGKVKAIGKKENVISMFDDLFDYYDKNMIKVRLFAECQSITLMKCTNCVLLDNA